jgi:hypothetical protein
MHNSLATFTYVIKAALVPEGSLEEFIWERESARDRAVLISVRFYSQTAFVIMIFETEEAGIFHLLMDFLKEKRLFETLSSLQLEIGQADEPLEENLLYLQRLILQVNLCPYVRNTFIHICTYVCLYTHLYVYRYVYIHS